MTIIGLAVFLFCYVSAGIWSILSSLYGMIRLGGRNAIGRMAA